jgi:hypothetical protein
MIYIYTGCIVFLYYALFTYNEKHKAFMCMILTLLSAFTSYYNNDIVFTRPWETGMYVVETNALLVSYFIIDLMNMIYTDKLRKAVVFHHIFILIPHLCMPSAIGVTFPIMGEIYSTGALFNLTYRQDLIYRAFTILTLRPFIWYKLFMCGFIPNQQAIYWSFPLIISTGMFCLDIYWLKKIYINLNKQQTVKPLTV